MAKQTFTTGQVLTAAQMTSLQQTAMLGGAASAKVASYVLVAADAGDAITMSNAGATTITVNTGLFAAGDIVTIINLGAGVCTITAGTATVSTSGSLALAQNQGGVLRFTSASAAIFLQFATPASGDIEGVTAGTGISGGGTSGTVTITNSMATEITAKGDLIAGTGNATFDNLPVGSDTQILVADSTASTGLKWATPAGSSLTIAQIASGTMPAASSLSLTGLSSYDTLIVRLDSLTWATNNASVMVTINSDTAANYELVGGYNQTTYSVGFGSTATNYFYAGFGAASQLRTNTSNWRFYVFENCKAAGFTRATVQESFTSSGGDTPNSSSVGIYKSAAAVSSIQFKTSTGDNYSAGNYTIWGG
jgi:hypothetical protein